MENYLEFKEKTLFKKALTISVAAFNVEAYLDQLMQSVILANVMEKLEILIIDDGSQDRTADIAKKYQLQYPDSVRLITKQNGGHGSTINRGIEEATGKYFRALDGDDWVNPEHLACLVNKIDGIHSDIILSDWCACYENGNSEVSDEFPELIKGHQYHFSEIWHPNFWMRYHTVIYKTDILKNQHIQLAEHCFYVDVEFMLYPIPYIDTIFYYKDFIYCYRTGNQRQSVSNKSRMKNIAHSRKVSADIIDYYLKKQSELSKEKRQYFLDYISFHCRWHEESLFLFSPSKEIKKELIEFDRGIKEIAPEIYRKMSNQSKVTRLLRMTGFHAYWFVRFVINRRSGGNSER